MILPLLLVLSAIPMAAIGTAEIRIVQCRTARDRSLPLLHAADRATARRDARTANTLLDAALTALGRAYLRPRMSDGTGMRLILARIAAR